MPPAGFEPTIPASEKPQTYALDRAATGTGSDFFYQHFIQIFVTSIRTVYPANLKIL